MLTSEQRACCLITQPFPKVNGRLTNPPLKFRHGLVIASHSFDIDVITYPANLHWNYGLGELFITFHCIQNGSSTVEMVSGRYFWCLRLSVLVNEYDAVPSYHIFFFQITHNRQSSSYSHILDARWRMRFCELKLSLISAYLNIAELYSI